MKHALKVARIDVVCWPVKWGMLGAILALDLLVLILALIKLPILSIAFGFASGLSVAGLIMPFYSSQGHNLDGMFTLFNFQRSEVVLGHFLYGLGFILLVILNYLCMAGLMTFLAPGQAGIEMIPAICLAMVGFLVFLLSVQYPFVINLDYGKALWGVVISLCIVMFLAPTVGTELSKTGLIGILICIVGVIVVLFSSIWLCIRLYQKKEF